ncbi:hypothetical protein CAP35_02365 [Chitinophagaceae bacterium IBVUCB1]|nr:hypothetical protein CAP35_02365 [Chitinophagaceae bacterium IBVUCB1]
MKSRIYNWFKKITLVLTVVIYSNSAYSQYCTTSLYSTGCFWGDQIEAVATSGGSTNISNWYSGCAGGSAYAYYSTQNLTIAAGGTFTLFLLNNYYYDEYYKVWIDYNADGDFYDVGEQVYQGALSIYAFVSTSVTVPSGTSAGLKRMRVRCWWNGNSSMDPCMQYGFGEVEDYNVTVTGGSGCTGTPAPGNTLTTANPVCPSTSFTLSLQNATSGSGVSYQWQTSPNGSTWTNVSGATSSTYTTTQSVATHYRCAVTCGSNTGFSNSQLINMNSFLGCYCAANYTSGCGFSDVITNVTFGTLNNTSGCTAVPASTDYGSSVAAPTINLGTSTPISVTVGAGGSEHVAVWIDYNQNGVFETTEYTYVGRGNGTTLTTPINVPSTALTGVTKMRVRVRYSFTTTPQILATDPCTTFSWGETEDYNVNLVCTLPSFGSHPSSTTLCAGNNVTFSASATGSGITYQWQENSGFGFTNITNGGVYSGATSANLTLVLPPATFNGYQYRCVAGISCGTTTAISNVATLTLGTTTAILGNPPNQTVCNGSPTSFTINAVASNITYQWQVHDGTGYYNLSNGGIYSNVNGATLNISSVSPAINGFAYRCVITGSCPPFSMTSSAGSLTIGSGVPIISQPASVIACATSNSSFTVTGGSSGISHQWQVNTGSGYANVTNGGVYSGATSATLNITGTPLTFNGYQYRCVLSNSCTAPVLSNAALLTVNALPVITSQPPAVTTSCDFQTASIAVAASGTSLSYQWQINAGLGFINLTNTPPYSGALDPTLNIANVNSSMNGFQYRCVVTGTCTPAVISNVSTLNILNRPVLTSNPATVTMCAGDNTSFTVGATGTNLTYQWQVATGTNFVNVTNGGVYSGATTPILTLTSVPNTMHSVAYRCEVSGTCPASVTSGQALLFVNSAPTVSWQPTDMQVCAGSNVVFTTNGTAATIVGSLSYQWQVNTGSGFTNLVNGAPYSNVTTPNLTITGATIALNNYMYRCVISNSTCLPVATTNAAMLTVNTLPTVTTQPTDKTVCPGSNTNFSISATGTNIVYQWQVNAGTGYVNVPGTPPYTGSNNPTLMITSVTPAMHNYLYRCVVRGTCSPIATSAAARLNVHNPIVINSNSLTDTFCEGGTSKLGVRVTGAGVMYQWQIKSGTAYVDLTNIPPYSGVNTDSLRISGAPATFNGNVYRCAITETQLCNLWFFTPDIPVGVRPLPATNPENLIIPPLHVAVFTVPNTGTSYQWQEDDNKGGGYKDLREGIPYKGVYTNTLIIDPIQLTMSGNKYRCVINGVCVSTVTSKFGTLVIDPALSVSGIKSEDNGVTVYPNPMSGNELNIVFRKDVKGATDIKVMDKLGKVVYKTTIEQLKNNIASINLQALAAGVYMIQVANADSNISETIQFAKQ